MKAQKMPGRQFTEVFAAQVASARVKYSNASHAVSSSSGDGVVRGCGSLDTILGLAFNYPTPEASS